MKKHITSICILQTFLILQLSGQSFTFHSNSPFGIKTMRADSTRTAQQIMFYDMDGDDDLDLLLTGLDYFDDVDPMGWEHLHWFIEMQENTGDRWNPQFGERVEVFNNFPYPLGYFFPTIGDINQDQKPDFIINGEVDFIGNRNLVYLKSNGSGGNDFEVIRGDTIGLKSFVPESFFVPHLVDLDQDGDLDIMGSGFDPAFAEEDGADVPQFYYARNAGSKSEPTFESWYQNPYELTPHPLSEVLTSGDIDKDGDIDLAGFTLGVPDDSIYYLYIHLNTPGVNQRPSFATTLQSPYGLPVTMGEQQQFFPQFVDIDSDGDLDLFVFQGVAQNSVLAYHENQHCVTQSSEMLVTLCEGDAIEVGGEMYTDAGTYTIHLQGTDGCDSIVSLSIQVTPPTEVMIHPSICQGESYVIGNETFTVSGDYTVFVAASNGCDSIVYLSLTVHDNYIINIDESLCQGETYTIADQQYTVSGQYDIHLLSVTGCDSLISLDLIFHETDNTITVEENILTANQTGATYQWFDCDSAESISGATAQTYEVTVSGNYGVVITGTSGCIVFSDCQPVVINGIYDPELSKAITILPNPADTEIRILNTSSYPVTHIYISNLTGQIVSQARLDGSQVVDVSSLVPGVYMVKLEMGGKLVMKKVVVM